MSEHDKNTADIAPVGDFMERQDIHSDQKTFEQALASLNRVTCKRIGQHGALVQWQANLIGLDVPLGYVIAQNVGESLAIYYYSLRGKVLQDQPNPSICVGTSGVYQPVRGYLWPDILLEELANALNTMNVKHSREHVDARGICQLLQRCNNLHVVTRAELSAKLVDVVGTIETLTQGNDLNLTFHGQRRWVAIWDVSNCLILARWVGDGTTELSLISYKRQPPDVTAIENWNQLGQLVLPSWINGFTPFDPHTYHAPYMLGIDVSLASWDLSEEGETKYRDIQCSQYTDQANSIKESTNVERSPHLEWRIFRERVIAARSELELREAALKRTSSEAAFECYSLLAESAVEMQAQYAGDLNSLHALLYRIDLDHETQHSPFRVLFDQDPDTPGQILPATRGDMTIADWTIGLQIRPTYKEFTPVGGIHAWLQNTNRVDVRFMAYTTDRWDILDPFFTEIIQSGEMRVLPETDPSKKEQMSETQISLKPWELIPDHGWDRQVLELWHEGFTCPEIQRKTHVASAERIRNRLTELRNQYGENIIPTDEQRKQHGRASDEIL